MRFCVEIHTINKLFAESQSLFFPFSKCFRYDKSETREVVQGQTKPISQVNS